MKINEQPILPLLARLGFVGKGVVYVIVGILALQTSLGISGKVGSTQKALKTLLSQPFGTILLVGCIIGLLAHAVWRIIKGIKNPDVHHSGTQSLLFRFVDVIVGGIYLSLSYAAWQILRGYSTQSSGENTEIWISKILQLPFGKWLVLICALVMLIIALYQFYSAYKAKFEYRFDEHQMDETERRTIRIMGRIGFSAWGVVYLMMTTLFYKAAVNYNADQAGGLSDALQALRNQPFGLWILNITAVGLLIYGAYLLVLSYFYQNYK